VTGSTYEQTAQGKAVKVVCVPWARRRPELHDLN